MTSGTTGASAATSSRPADTGANVSVVQPHSRGRNRIAVKLHQKAHEAKGQPLSAGPSKVAKLVNDRPCKTLGWKTPAQALAEEIANAAKTVAIGA